MWPKSAKHQLFKIHHSLRLDYWRGFWHCIAIFSVGIAALPLWIQGSLLLLIIIHAWVDWKHNSSALGRVLSYTETQGWQLAIGQTVETITIQPTTFISTFIILLHYKTPQGPCQVLAIPYDALPRNDFRTLYVILKTSQTS